MKNIILGITDLYSMLKILSSFQKYICIIDYLYYVYLCGCMFKFCTAFPYQYKIEIWGKGKKEI